MKLRGPKNEELDVQDTTGWPEPAEVAVVGGPLPSDLEPVASATPGTPAKPQGRPSLDVAIETHRNLQKRVEALYGRLMGWSQMDGCDETIWKCFVGNVKGVLEFTREVGEQLQRFHEAGFVAKTTKRSRIEARLECGLPIRLSEAKRKLFSYAYTAEEMEQVSVVGKSDDGTIWVKLGNRPGVLPVPVKLSDLESV